MCQPILTISAINPKLIKDFDNDSLRKVKSDKADAVKIARYALDKWQNLKQYSVMDELRNQLKTMNRQFGFYMKLELFVFFLYSLTVCTAISAARSLGNINTPVEIQQNAMESTPFSSAISRQDL